MERRAILIVALFAMLALLVVPVYPHFLSPNEFTRWAFAEALIEHHTTEVSSAAAVLGPRFEDLSSVGGRLYSNKAPGGALVGTIGYLVARHCTTSLRALVNAMRIAASSVPLILLAMLIIRLGRRFGHADRLPIAIATLLFATPMLAYGLLLFGHALVAATLFGAWAFLFVEDRPAIAGALIGIAVISDYPAAVPALILIVIAALDRNWRRIGKVLLAGLPFAVILGLYHYISFGGVFQLPYANYEYAPFRELSRSGVYGIGLPSLTTLVKFFLDPGFGLFVLSPVLVASLFAVRNLQRALTARALTAFVLAPLATILIYAGYANWQGGWSVGPRYIVSIVPFFSFALLFGKRSWIEPLLLGFSATVIAMISLVFPFVPLAFAWPWGTLALPLLAHGLVAPNLLHFVWRPAAVIVPFIAVAIAVVVATGKSWWIATSGAAIALAIAILAATHGSVAERVQRAYIEDVYFEQRGALERSLPPGVSRASPIFRRRDVERRLAPPSWPF